jgi:1,4-alpha-glucan branching enzyme
MIKKRFIKTKKTCKVTFELPEDIEAKSASLVGEFNNWDEVATPLKKVKGVWKTTVELDQGKEYQYRYLVNGEQWYNDWDADKYVPNFVNGDNSVVET